MRATLVAVPMLALLGGSLAVTVAADAAASRASTTVTIKAEGTDMSGTVKSPKPKKCADERKVIVIKQKGARGGGDDTNFAMDTSEKQGNSYVWSTGNTGTEGKFYAKVKKTAHCKGDTSPTIKVKRPEEPTRAAAKAKRAKVKVKIAVNDPLPTGFHGTVSSKRPKKCAKGATVKVFMVGGDGAFGSAETVKEDGKFTYSVMGLIQPGDYYAKVKKSASCKVGKSKTIPASGVPLR